jgi:NADPH-dependent curcumin reductase CurA
MLINAHWRLAERPVGARLPPWLRNGELRSREDVVHGDIDQLPDVLLGLFHGTNTGKLVLALTVTR